MTMTLKKYYFILVVTCFIFGCNQTRLNSPLFDNLKQGDTLTFYAEFVDCGEWGGHIEKVIIINKENDFIATLYIDSASCDSATFMQRKEIFNKSKILSTFDKNDAITYIDSFMVANRNPSYMRGAYSSISYKIITKDTSYSFNDYSYKWEKFNKMKSEIFE